MGWQARLPKDKKPDFKRTCNKCGGTGVRRRIKDGVYRDPKTGFKHFNGDFDVKCSCVLKKEAQDKRRAEQDAADRALVEGLLKEENAAVVE